MGSRLVRIMMWQKTRLADNNNDDNNNHNDNHNNSFDNNNDSNNNDLISIKRFMIYIRKSISCIIKLSKFLISENPQECLISNNSDSRKSWRLFYIRKIVIRYFSISRSIRGKFRIWTTSPWLCFPCGLQPIPSTFSEPVIYTGVFGISSGSLLFYRWTGANKP